MNCREWEDRLALYTGGDLGEGERAQVEGHLRDCPGCQMFASGLADTLALLKREHGEAPAEAQYAAVRARVLGEIRAGARRRWLWAAACAAAAVIALVAMIGLRSHRDGPRLARTEPPAEVVKSEPPPEAARSEARDVTRRVAARRRPQPARTERKDIEKAKPEPLVLKLVTDDPDVVIYWITETTGEPR